MRGIGRHDPRGDGRTQGRELSPQPGPRPLGLSLQPHDTPSAESRAPPQLLGVGGTVQDGDQKD